MGFNFSTRWRIQTKDRFESFDPPADFKSIVQAIEDHAAGAAQIVADVAARDAIPAAELYVGKRVITLSDNFEYRRTSSGWTLHSGKADFAPGNFSGTVVNADTNSKTKASRSGWNVTLAINVNVGSNGLASGGAICTVPALFVPESYGAGRLDVVNSGTYQNTQVPVQVDASGVMTLKAGSVAANLVLIGNLNLIGAN